MNRVMYFLIYAMTATCLTGAFYVLALRFSCGTQLSVMLGLAAGIIVAVPVSMTLANSVPDI